MRPLAVTLVSLLVTLGTSCSLRGTEQLQTPPCPLGFADCDGDGTCEADLVSVDHCGACNYACAVACDSGVCVLDDGAVAVTTVSVYEGGAHVYFNDYAGGRILRVPKAGGERESVATSCATPRAIHVDETQYFWTCGGSEGAAPPDGYVGNNSKAEFDFKTVTAAVNPWGIDGDLNVVVWAQADDGSIRYRVKNNALVEEVLLPAGSGIAPGFIAIDADYVFGIESSNGGTVYRVGRGVAPVLTTLADSDRTLNAANLAIDETHVYWTTAQGQVQRIDKEGEQFEVMNPTDSKPVYGIAVDATHVYWSVQGPPGELRRMPKTGGEQELLATSSRPLEGWGGLALADDSIYWAALTIEGGAAHRILKRRK